MALSDVIARLAVSLSLETAAFEKNSARAKKEVTGLEKHISKAGVLIKGAFVGIAGAIAAVQFADLAKRGLEYASSLGEVAAQLGVTTKALQEYRYAASQAGIETGEMDQALSQLTRRLGDAAQGAKEPTEALERLGISVRDSNGHVRDAGETIPLIAEGLQKIESPAERAAILVDLFGKAGQKLAPLMEGGAAGVNSLRDAAHELGIVLSDEQIQKADETADKLSAMKQVLEAKIASAVADNADSIIELAEALTKLVEAAGKAAKAWRYFSNLDWRPGAGTFSEQFTRMQMEDLGPGVELTDGAKAAIAARKNAPFLKPSSGLLLRTPKRSAAPTVQTPWGPLVQPGLSRAVGANAFGGSDLSRFSPGSGASDFMKVANDLAGASSVVAQQNKEAEASLRAMADVHGPRLAAVLGKLTPEGEQLRSATQGILDRLFPDEAEIRRFREELATLTAAMKKGQLSTEDYAKAVLAIRSEFSGFTSSYVESASEVVASGIGPTMQDAIDGANASWDRFADGLVNNSRTSRVQVAQSFENMAQDVLGTLNQLSNSIRGGSFLDILSGVIGLGLQLGSLGAFGKGVQGRLNKVPAYASGTNFHPGGIALVGERGPELVDLPRGARVTPNNEMGGMGRIAEIVPSPYFDVVVDGRIVRASPGIASAGAQGGVAQIRRSGTRRVA